MLRLWNDGWSFLRTEPGTELADIPGREEEFSPVVIPHDWLIGDVRHLYEDGTGWYRKRFMAGNWKYGYSAFDVSVGEYLKEGENEVLVQVRFLSPNSRWYSGAGIYRNVWIQVCGEAYLPMDGTYVSSVWEESSDEGRSTYSVRIDTECAGRMEPGVLCRYTLRAALYVGDAPEPADVRDITIGFCRKRFDPERCF